MARIDRDMGDTGRALLTLEKIEGLPEQIDGIDEQQIYWQYKAENKIYHGLRDEALISIENLKVLSQQSSSLESRIIALNLSLELNAIYKKHDLAKINVKQMLAILKNEQQEYQPIFNDLILAYDMLIVAFALLDIQWKNNMQDYIKTMNYLDEIAIFKYPIHKYKAQYLAHNKDYINAYVMMIDLKSKANDFWTTDDQLLLEKYQELAQ